MKFAKATISTGNPGERSGGTWVSFPRQQGLLRIKAKQQLPRKLIWTSVG
jgi:hypothetical protein